MRSMKLFQLAVLFLIRVTVFTNTPALAQLSGHWGPIDLTNTGAEPGAKGQATLSLGVIGIRFQSNYVVATCSGTLSVTCQGLTPGKVYRVGPVYSRKGKTFTSSYLKTTALSDGTAGAQGGTVFEVVAPLPRDATSWWYTGAYRISVDQNNGVQTSVLTGAIPFSVGTGSP
jgi:hypothetical protein